MHILLRILFFCFGLWFLLFTFFSIVRTFVVPRNEKVFLIRFIFYLMKKIFSIILLYSKSFFYWDRVLALYAPLSLLALSVTGIGLIWISYSAIFMGLNIPFYSATSLSGGFLLTLTGATDHGLAINLVGFSESVFGLVTIALLVSFLPTIYSAFSKREVMVTRLEYRAGSNPSGVEIIARLIRHGEAVHLDNLWSSWENWFVEMEESHTSLYALAFFRSPKPHRSWVNAAGAILDAAALVLSTVEKDHYYQAEMCYQAGVSALCGIAEFLNGPDSLCDKKNGTINITQEQYRLACLKLRMQGVSLKTDSDQLWTDFKKLRMAYESALLFLAKLTVAPENSWANASADKSLF